MVLIQTPKRWYCPKDGQWVRKPSEQSGRSFCLFCEDFVLATDKKFDPNEIAISRIDLEVTHIQTNNGCIISCNGQGHLPCNIPEHQPNYDSKSSKQEES